MEYLYLAALLVSLAGMLMIDRVHQVALWHDARRTSLVVAIGVAVFIVWDIFGIALGIFFSGRSQYMSGLYLGPEFPIEELLFLTFLCYFTLIVYLIGARVWPRT